MIDFQNLKNQKVVVVGLGLLGGGVETVKWLIKKGAKVLVTDLKKRSQLKESLKKLKGLPVKYVLGKHQAKDFREVDLIIKNPGVPKESKYLKIAKKDKIPIESDLSLFFRLFKGKIIGITGTKGKSTTVSLLAAIFKQAKKKFILGGNIGQSPLQHLDKKYPLALLEISSWQLEDMKHLKKNPQVACLTTLFPDHLNRYKNFKEYLAAKKLIFKWQKREDFLILNYDNKITRNFARQAKGRVFYFSAQKPPKRGTFIKNNKIFFCDKKREKEIAKLDDIKIKISINSLLAAITIASICKISPKLIKKALRNFKGVVNRSEFVREKNGVEYYNDSTSTVPQSTILALDLLTNRKNVILISGGADKKLDFREMAKKIKEKCRAVILLPGTATRKIEKELRIMNYELRIKAKTMKEAVKIVTKNAGVGDVVLLSPGCASFGLFQNAYDRARQFKQAVFSL